MKVYRTMSLIAILTLALVSCKNNIEPEIRTVEVASQEEQQIADPNATYAKVEFNIEGMTCAMGCAKTIEKKMAKMEGVKMAKVDFDKKLAMVEYDEAKVTPTSLKEAVAKVGDVYKVIDLKTVDDFSTERKPCKEDCKMECCKDKSKEDKVACAEDCKMECCKSKNA